MSDPARPDDDTSSSLLVRVKNRDPDACLRLVEWIGPFILSWCRRAGLQPADRDEVSQQALLNVWGRLAAFRKEKPGDSFRGWVYSITRSRILDLWARQRAAPRPLSAEPPADDASSEKDWKQRALHLLIKDLAARHAADHGFKAFYRTAVDGLSSAEAARELGVSADVVRQQKCRWIKRLRDQLRQQFGELLD